MIPHVLYVSSNNLIVIEGLKNVHTDEYCNTATVTMVVLDSTFEEVSDDIAFSYVTDSDGNYHGIIPYTVDLTPSSIYYVDITTTVGSIQRTDRLRCRAEYAIGH